MKKVISYSLYNARYKDVVNAVVNCFLAQKIYKDWICRFYIDETVPDAIKKALQTFSNVEIVEMPRHKQNEGLLWRFFAAADDTVDVMISRDADSWLSYREYSCVEQFLNSDKEFHIIRDHCYHSHKIMAGMWGSKKGCVNNFKNLIDEHINSGMINDQRFLAEKIYPDVVSKCMIHLGDQYDNRGNKTNGYFNDGGISIPNYSEYGIDNFSFIEANRLNAFHCAHCKKTHDVLIGGITEKIPQQTINYLKQYFTDNGIDCSGFDRKDGNFA